MNTKTTLIAAAILGALTSSSLSASTVYAFLNSRAANQNSEVWNGQTEDIGPYGGSIGSSSTGGAGNSAVNLFCDDYADGVGYGTGWQVNITAVNSSNLTNTRYGSANLNPSYPSGTTLYEEIAWLFTQTMQTGQSIKNQDAIGEAVWYMTGGSNTPKVTATATGTDKTYLQWISAARADYNTTVSGYTTPDYSKWMIVTDVTAHGNTGGVGKQEFLAYYTAAGVPQINTALQSAPEPSTYLLSGFGLLAAGLFGRRKVSKR